MKSNLINNLMLVMVALLLFTGEAAAAKIRAVTSTEDLAAIVREVGGDRVEVTSLTRGYQDPHFVDARPSYLVKLNKADLFFQIGLDLEVGWVPALLTSARNPKILPGARGFVNVGSSIRALEVPSSVDRSQGDVHPLGNPHYWLDPANGITMSLVIRDALIRTRPADAGTFNSRQADFQKRLETAIGKWTPRARALGLAGMKVVTYHRSWSYFEKAFGLSVIDVVEPKPGVPPSAGHTHALIETMKAAKVPLLIVETYFDPKLPERVAHDTGARLVILPSSVGARPDIRTYFDLFDRQLDLLEGALKRS